MSSRMFESAVSPPTQPSPNPLWFLISSKGLLVRAQDDRLTLPTTAQLETSAISATDTHFLGRLNDEDCFALPLPESVPAGFEVRPLRGLFTSLGEELWSIAGRAVQIVEWDATHRFCGRCATPTVRDPSERARSCPACGLRAYPRVAPAVIVLVRKGDQALLARGARFPVAFYSTLAGFVEPGESLEETVAREIREEVGVEVTNLRYFGSQPWPFPHSLMVGFNADFAGGELKADGTEILDASWFSADALPMIPPKPSIARALIDAWVADVANR